MLYVHCTAKLAKAARIPLKQAPEPAALHWLDCWYANLIEIEKFSNVVLLTNAQSLYSVLISQSTPNVVMFGTIAGFTRRLADRLASLNVDAESISTVTEHHAHYAAYKTASRRVLGSMNEMVFHLRWMIEEQPDITVEALEDVLNELPSKVLDYAVPLEKLEVLLADQAENGKAFAQPGGSGRGSNGTRREEAKMHCPRWENPC